MIAHVHMLAFQEGVVRLVELPEGVEPDLEIRALLEMVFHYGQNDFQPRVGCCSVSMGDVAEIDGHYYLCCPLGWRGISRGEFVSYKAMDRHKRRSCKLMTENPFLRTWRT